MAPYGYTGAPTSSNRYHRNFNSNSNDAPGHANGHANGNGNGNGSPVTPAVTGIDYPSNEDVSVEADLYTTSRRDLNPNPGYYPPTAYRGGGHNNSYSSQSQSQSQSQSYSVSQKNHTRSHSRSQSQSQSQSQPHSFSTPHSNSNSQSQSHSNPNSRGLYTHPNIAGSTLDSPPFPSPPPTDPEDSHTRALTAVWDRIRAEKEAKMAREKPKVQSLDEMAQEFLVINNNGGYGNGYGNGRENGYNGYNEDSYNSRSREMAGKVGQRSDRDRGDRRTDSERRGTRKDRADGRIPVMEASSPPTVSPPPISAGKGQGRSMRKPKSISNFRESTDGTAMVATFDLPEVVDKQDIHISFQRNRLVLTWEVGEVTEWVEGGEDEDEESRAHDFEEDQEEGSRRKGGRERDMEREEREGGRVVLREHVRRMYHRTLPLPEGTRFEEIQAQMTSRGLILRYPNMRCFRVDGRSRSGDS